MKRLKKYSEEQLQEFLSYVYFDASEKDAIRAELFRRKVSRLKAEAKRRGCDWYTLYTKP